MLRIEIPMSPERWDEEKQEFIKPRFKTIQLEHSLVSLKKWESKWHKPFLSKEEKTFEETIDYIKCMTLTQNVGDEVYEHLSQDNIKQINDYIGNPMTATTFSNNNRKKNSQEIITAEIVYYWMIAFGIPPEYQKWHLNSLLTLIRVCEAKNETPKKKSRREVAEEYAAMNAKRRQQLKSKG